MAILESECGLSGESGQEVAGGTGYEAQLEREKGELLQGREEGW
jgi:hypothetical protein